LGQGGGRFDGHPTAALIAGASCVLSSVHALWDDSAKEFSERLYGKALHPDQPLCLSAALLQTRREMAANDDNPLLWATTVLWGNPWARLA
jgi:CHAT domain-containing protein